jgi:hypothetical protein
MTYKIPMQMGHDGVPHPDYVAIAEDHGARRFNERITDPELRRCWIDRVLYLPVAAEKGPEALAAAVAECNRYAGGRT